MVRAKFQVHQVNFTVGGIRILASPVYSNKEGSENKAFCDASPSGVFEMSVNQSASGYPEMSQYHPGAQFYMDLSIAPKETA